MSPNRTPSFDRACERDGIHLSRLVTDDDAISSVIASVLLVAVTIVLAAAIGTFLLGIGTSVTQTKPTIAFATAAGSNGGVDTINVTHGSGSTVPAKALVVRIGGSRAWSGTSGATSDFAVVESWSGAVTSGDTLRLREDGANSIRDGDELTVVWVRGDRSSVLYRDDVSV